MGLPVSVHVRGPDPASAQPRVEALFDALRAADRVFSTYRDDSDLARWERGAVDVDPALGEVFALCEEARVRTGGWFDARSLPDPRTGRLRYDPSGLVKGWAVQRAAEPLRGLPGHDWCINAGGDVYAAATPTAAATAATTAATAADKTDSGRPWRVGIEDPADPRQVAAVVPLTTGAVATSGTTHRGAHILDPTTGRPATAVRAATVTGPSLLWADVYATAAVARGTDALPWLEEMPHYEARLTLADGTVRTTTSFGPKPTPLA
ncbi:FAD:protein FMN transferase [Cryptosporangium phraense]|uniref:FAD:protein FMN transferase n=2 Tax=Cryptosporangium phraense TaxID=2593070 RepID=A0A545ALI4_9ACTN|nr:FAD:protein FMN transferase [Cryptosporangium phraense]